MIEKEMDLWDAPRGSWVGITTNGVVKADGRLVLGAGVAREARDRFPGLDAALGWLVGYQGNRVLFVPGGYGFKAKIFSFPTKDRWTDPSDLSLVIRSAKELAHAAGNFPGDTFYLPRPGCGLGGLRWEDVREAISVLPDNVIIVHKGGPNAQAR